MKGVGRMTEVLHPGLILILTAFIALAAPYALRLRLCLPARQPLYMQLLTCPPVRI